MDLVGHWGLEAKPFANTYEPASYCETDLHAEAVARLRLLARDGSLGLGMLTGETGSGKTFVARFFAQTLDLRRFEPVFIPNGSVGFAGVLDQVNSALRRESATGRLTSHYEMLVEFRRLFELRVRGRWLHLVVVIDEAQDMSARDLLSLRALLNEAASSPPAMTAVLVGTAELARRVRSLPAVESRVGLRYHLRHLATYDVAKYLAQGLVAAGHPTGTVFTIAAVNLLASFSKGLPREVNRLARLALYRAAARGARAVEAEDVGCVAEARPGLLRRSSRFGCEGRAEESRDAQGPASSVA